MELANFFKFLYRNISVLILIPVVTVLITYFLVRSLPDSYIAQGQISTGIVDKSDEINLTDAPPLQQAEVDQKFSNLIQMMQLQRIITLVSYKLFIHDLTQTPYKKLSSRAEDLSAKEKAELVSLASQKYKVQQTLYRGNPNEAKLDDVINSMKYEVGSIKQKLTIYRVAQSDYINIEFNSTNPELSAFVVNTIANEFINDYTRIITNTGERSVDYLSKLLDKKQDALNSKMNVLKYYKISNNVLNLPEQARILFDGMISVEGRQADLQKEIISTAGAIKAIENKFNQRDRRYFEATQTKVNSETVLLKEKAKVLSNAYIENDFDPVIRKQMDSVIALTNRKINDATDESIFNPFAVKQELIAQKLTLQTQLEIARNSVNSLERLHNKLYSQFTRLVPFEASIQTYERDIDIASKEYLDILNRYNNTSMQTTFVAKLKYPQPAGPGALQPSKKMLLIILSGIISFVFCIIVLFALFYFDDAVETARQLANRTALPVIGQLELMPNTSLNIKNIWDESSDKLKSKAFKDQLRAIRLELNQELKDSKILAITSFGPGEGKTFVSLNIAYAYAVTNKKILVIDGNFIHSELTNSLKQDNLSYIEDFLTTGTLPQITEQGPSITVIGNKGGDQSVLEIADQLLMEDRFNHLRSIFDLIIIETPSLISTETSKEWILFVDKIIGVFEFKEYITEAKREQLNYIKSLDLKFIGWIFNKVIVESGKKSWFKRA